jgi:hypothetical protein
MNASSAHRARLASDRTRGPGPRFIQVVGEPVRRVHEEFVLVMGDHVFDEEEMLRELVTQPIELGGSSSPPITGSGPRRSPTTPTQPSCWSRASASEPSGGASGGTSPMTPALSCACRPCW